MRPTKVLTNRRCEIEKHRIKIVLVVSQSKILIDATMPFQSLGEEVKNPDEKVNIGPVP